MTDLVSSLFDKALERYQQGESPEQLIPLFQDICDKATKNSPAWTCLAWLYLLNNQPNLALKAAQKAVKLNPTDAQSRVNLALALLETKGSGVREHIELADKLIMVDEETKNEIKKSIADGFERKPDWTGLQKVKNWLFPS
jgi:predicted Zn-dependent protease